MELIGNFCCHLGCSHVKAFFYKWLFTGKVTVLPLRYFQQLPQWSGLLLTKGPPDLSSWGFLQLRFFIVYHLVANICLEVSLTNYASFRRIKVCKQIICLLAFTTTAQLKFLSAWVFGHYVAVKLRKLWVLQRFKFKDLTLLHRELQRFDTLGSTWVRQIFDLTLFLEICNPLTYFRQWYYFLIELVLLKT